LSKIIKNTLLYSIGNLLPQLVAFILLPIYTKYLLPEDYGVVNAMVTVQALFAVFFSLALDRSIIRLYWDYNEKEKGEFLGTLFIAMSAISIIMLGLVFLFKNYIHLLFGEIAFYPFFIFTIFMTFSLNFFLIPKNYYRLKSEALKFLLLSICEVVITTSLIFYFLVVKEEGAYGVIKGKFYSSVLLLPFFLYITIMHVKLKFNYKILSESLKFSLPILPTLFAAWVLGQADRVFIAGNLSYHDLGIYSLSKRLGGLVAVIAGAFTMAYHPIFFELVNDTAFEEKTKSVLYRYNNSFILLLLYIGFMLALFSKEFIYYFLNYKYFVAYYYIPPIILGVIIASISSSILGAFIQQSKKMKQDMIFGLVVAGITLLSYSLLIKSFGLAGAVFASIISSLSLFILLYFYTKKRCFFIPFNWLGIIPISFIMFFTIILFNYLFSMDPLVGLFVKTLVAVCFISYYFCLYRDSIFQILNRNRL
jgi:O-antigen/teichoic acid export membrane protein